MQLQEFIQKNTGLQEREIGNVLELLKEGATIPFIARYRKERTGNMDEVAIGQIRDFSERYQEIITRRKTILKAIEAQGRLDDHLNESILSCFDLVQLEDIYFPFKQKRLTRGEKARKKGLEPLAKMIMSQRGGDPEAMAERFLKGEIYSEKEAIDGAKDIMAEWMSENVALRDRLRKTFENYSVLSSSLVKGKEEAAEKYRDYFDFSQPLKHCPSHRFLAIYRASKEGLLRMKVRPNEEQAIEQVERFFVRGHDACAAVVREACTDAYRRLIRPSLENEWMAKRKEKADREAIGVFEKNLRQLLLAAPLGNKRVLAIDPGFRTGCKVVCLNDAGELLTNATIYPHPPQKEDAKAKSKIAQLVQAYKIEAIAIGDGTAGRETERLIKSVHFDRDVEVFSVREDGASIYSASAIARKEFPDYDVTVRGAVSIGRRLIDPLAELVKIDPKSIGVGQYQHEVDQKLLKSKLDDVVISCVNAIGVDLNTASSYLLSYVSGLSPSLAEEIVAYRSKIGAFGSREELKKVPRLGSKTFEQAAGFLRIRDGKNPLDNTGIHPESYSIVQAMAGKLGKDVASLLENNELLSNVASSGEEGANYTLQDIISELRRPGRDPRSKAKVLEFDHRIKAIEDLKEGMLLRGIVTNVTNFGAFVNIGIKENGLIHKSKLADAYVEDPSEYISLHQHVEVSVEEVDLSRKRIGLKLIR